MDIFDLLGNLPSYGNEYDVIHAPNGIDIMYVTVVVYTLSKTSKLVCKRRYRMDTIDISACRPTLILNNSASRTVTCIVHDEFIVAS